MFGASGLASWTSFVRNQKPAPSSHRIKECLDLRCYLSDSDKHWTPGSDK